MKLRQLYKQYLKQFQENNIPEFSLKILLCYFFNIKDNTEFIIKLDDDVQELTKDQNKKIIKVLQGFPVQYIIKNVNFGNLDFYVDKGVLIPRNETEELVYIIIKEMKNKFEIDRKLSLIDLGSGSGVIPITIEKNTNFTFINLIGVDCSKKAIKIANRNKKYQGSTVNFVKKDMFKYIKNNTTKFNVIISNPPYISKIYEVEDSVLKHEPKIALFENPSYKYYEKILSLVPKLASSDFILGFEIGHDQKTIIEQILKHEEYFKNVEYNFIKDIYGKDRFLILKSK